MEVHITPPVQLRPGLFFLVRSWAHANALRISRSVAPINRCPSVALKNAITSANALACRAGRV